MEIEDQVASYDQSLKLVKLGVRLESVWSWEIDTKELCFDVLSCPLVDLSDLYVPSYTVAEMMYILHNYTNWEFLDLRDNQAEYLVDILINEITDGQIKVEDLKL